ncbi:MAG: glycoside hydrolase family 9 protein [Acetatifactor sp.]|nr:glycoside hydrolase family 9 protein [Acetatifactor sp.]
MRHFGRMVRWGAICLILSIFCGGCTALPNNVNTEENPAPVSMENAPIVNYAVPSFTPNILIDQNGYQTQGEKTAIVKGTRLPEAFRLVDCETGDVVYMGTVENSVFNKEFGIYTGSADFGDYVDAVSGQYYLECDHIGRSYSFPISITGYQDLFEEIYQEISTDCKSGEATIEDVLALLIAYERYGEIFTDKDQNEVPDVMEVLRQWIEQIDYGQIDAEQGALYAAGLAKFSYLYQWFDLDFANTCLQRASTVFARTQGAVQRDAENFFALTELYRATGLFTYRNRILNYKALFQNNYDFLEENGYLYGAMTYMVTRQSVDVELCDLFMNRLIAKGEEISDGHEEMIYSVGAGNNGAEDILRQAKQLSGANYVLQSYQYNCDMEDFVHCLMGCNLQSVCYYPEDGDRDIYLILLAQLASIQEYRPLVEA